MIVGIFGLITGFCVGYIVENKNYSKLNERVELLENNSNIDRSFWGVGK